MLRSLDLVDTKLTRYATFGPLILRWALGLVFVGHAYAKAAIFTFPGTERFFEAYGFPGWTVYPVFIAELAGGTFSIAQAGWNESACAMCQPTRKTSWRNSPRSSSPVSSVGKSADSRRTSEDETRRAMCCGCRSLG